MMTQERTGLLEVLGCDDNLLTFTPDVYLHYFTSSSSAAALKSSACSCMASLVLFQLSKLWSQPAFLAFLFHSGVLGTLVVFESVLMVSRSLEALWRAIFLMLFEEWFLCELLFIFLSINVACLNHSMLSPPFCSEISHSWMCTPSVISSGDDHKASTHSVVLSPNILAGNLKIICIGPWQSPNNSAMGSGQQCKNTASNARSAEDITCMYFNHIHSTPILLSHVFVKFCNSVYTA